MSILAPKPLTYIFLFRLFVLFGRYLALSSALFPFSFSFSITPFLLTLGLV